GGNRGPRGCSGSHGDQTATWRRPEVWSDSRPPYRCVTEAPGPHSSTLKKRDGTNSHHIQILLPYRSRA
ncbi:unnamed protein product, partial [Arctogadus glacialis]